MSDVLGTRLPAALRAALNLDGPPGFTVVLMSTGADGWPHLAMLSSGEILPLDDRHLRVARGSRARFPDAVLCGQSATLAAVVDGTSLSVRLTARSAGDLTTRWGDLAVFDARIEEVRGDVAPYAVLESGIRFRLKEPEETRLRWVATHQALREMGPAASQ
jgi:hypothetical protein